MKLSRRHALTGVAGAAAASAVALPAVAAVAVHDPILDLARELEVARAETGREARILAICEKYKIAVCPKRWDFADQRVYDLIVEIMNTPATTLQGLAVKARIARREYERDMEGGDPMTLTIDGYFGFLLASDVERMAGGTS